MVKSGIIYKIYDQTDKKLVYYGSTEQSISERLGCHISDYKSYKNGNHHFVTSYLVFDADNYDIMMVERVEFGDIKELRNRERFYIENNICVNKIVPNRTDAEYYKANKDKILEDRVKYYKANKDKIAEQRAERYQENKAKINEKFSCICGGSYTYINKSRHEKTKKHTKYIASCEGGK